MEVSGYLGCSLLLAFTTSHSWTAKTYRGFSSERSKVNMCAVLDLFFKGRNKCKAFYNNVFRKIFGCNSLEVINTVQRILYEKYLPGSYKSLGAVEKVSFNRVRYTLLIIILSDAENPYTVWMRKYGYLGRPRRWRK